MKTYVVVWYERAARAHRVTTARAKTAMDAKKIVWTVEDIGTGTFGQWAKECECRAILISSTGQPARLVP